MKIKFYLKSSRIYDFLIFPSLINYIAWHDEHKNDDMFKEIDIDDYLKFVEGISEKLEPYKKDIVNYYTGPFTEDYNYVSLLIKKDEILHYNSVEQCLDFLLSLDEKEINERIVLSLLKNDEITDFNEEKKLIKMREICKDNANILDYIKGLALDANIKWSLHLATSDPVKHLKDYVELMRTLHPLFCEIYEPYISVIEVYGKLIEKTILEKDSEGIKELTYNLLDKNIIEADEICIIVSLMLSYSLLLHAMNDKSILTWGLRMSDAFKQLKEISEDRLNKKVQIFKNLADKTRYEVLKYIAAGETSTKLIAEALNVSSATVSYHISNFLTSKLIKVDRSKQKYGYMVDYELIEKTIHELREDLKFPE
jgi:DNA-binding transcriptional ArsR family regulator